MCKYMKKQNYEEWNYMRRNLCFLLLLLIIITAFLGCNKKTNLKIESASANSKQNGQSAQGVKSTPIDDQQNKELKKTVNDLITKSLDIQYGTSNIKLNEVFSNEFINRIQNMQNFYKKELKPYKILSLNYDEIKDVAADNFVVFARINDTKGEYSQTIHFIKKNGVLIINEVEYDI